MWPLLNIANGFNTDSFSATIDFGVTSATPNGIASIIATTGNGGITINGNVGQIKASYTYTEAFYSDPISPNGADENGQDITVTVRDTTPTHVGNAQGAIGFEVLDTITGTKFQDNNGLGFSNDSTYAGPGVTIVLSGTDATTDLAITPQSTVTGPGGTYSFTDIDAGTYTLSEVVPAGWSETGSPSGPITIATFSPIAANNNFADFQNATISGSKFEDTDSGSFTDPGVTSGVGANPYPGLAGWTIDLLNSTGQTVLQSTTTDANGNYSFSVAPGTYEVMEVSETGWAEVYPNFPNGISSPAPLYYNGSGGYTITVGGTGLGSGQTAAQNDFGNVELGAIYGVKYNDPTGYGVFDSSNFAPVQGVTIDLTGTDMLGNPVSLSTTTSASGQYSFTNLMPSNANSYSIAEVVPAGWTPTTNQPVTVGLESGEVVEAYASEASPADFAIHPQFVETPADGDLAIGDFQNIAISGTKYQGTGFDGRSFYNGPPVTVELTGTLASTGDPITPETAVTNPNGLNLYSFTDIAPGTYTVTEEVPTGWTETAGGPGTDFSNTIVVGGTGQQSGVASNGNDFVDGQPDLTITKTGSGTVNSTDAVSFTITVSNTGTAAALDVNLSDALPTATGVTWTGVTTSGVFPTATLSSNSVSDDLGTLNAGGSVTFVVSGTTSAGTSAILNNTATATATNNSPGSVDATATDTVLSPDLTISKTGSGTVNSTDGVSFTITVSNTGRGGGL